MDLLITTATMASTSHVMVFDCRSPLGNLGQGKKDFDAGHIPGAQHARMDQHLAAAPGDSGRRPPPKREALKTRIVCYDQNNSAFSVRLWWLCRWLGDDDVFVIDGGLEVWRSGFNKAFRFQLSRKPFLKDALPQWLH